MLSLPRYRYREKQLARPLARPHTLNIEDAVWDRLVEHSAKRGESASQFTNLVLRDALGMIPHEASKARDDRPGDIQFTKLTSAVKPLETTVRRDYMKEREDRLAAEARARLAEKGQPS